MVCLTVLFLNNQQIFTVLLSKLSWPVFRGDKILVFHTKSGVVSASSGSRPGHKVSGTRSKFPNLNENGQKSHFCEVFQTRNPVNILSRSAVVSHGEGSFKEPIHKHFFFEMSCEISG